MADPKAAETAEQPFVMTLPPEAKEDIRWIWPGRLAVGHVALLAGQTGIGKSLFALDVAARLSIGLPWPDHARLPKRGRVLVVGGPTRPEQRDLGVFCELFGFEKRITWLRGLRGRDGRRAGPISFPRHLDLLAETLRKRPCTRLIVIDPLEAVLSYGHTGQLHETLDRLGQIAWDAGAAVLAITQTVGRRPVAANRTVSILGGPSLAAAVPVILFMARWPNSPRNSVVIQLKNNLWYGDDPFDLHVSFDNPRDGKHLPFAVMPLVSARGLDVLTDPRRARAAELDWLADQWLLDRLNGGDRDGVNAVDLIEAASAQPFGRTRLLAAAERLGVIKCKDGWNGTWRWKLPEVPQLSADMEQGGTPP